MDTITNLRSTVDRMGGQTDRAIEIAREALIDLTRVVEQRDALLAALRECSDYLSMIPESAAGGDDDAVRLAKLADRAIAQVEGRA